MSRTFKVSFFWIFWSLILSSFGLAETGQHTFPEPARITLHGDLEKRLRMAIDWAITGRKEQGYSDEWLIDDIREDDKHAAGKVRGSGKWLGDIWGAEVETMALLTRLSDYQTGAFDSMIDQIIACQYEEGSFWPDGQAVDGSALGAKGSTKLPTDAPSAIDATKNNARRKTKRPPESLWPDMLAREYNWGWQRSLNGLVEYYLTYKDPKVLNCICRYGDFVWRTYEKAKLAPPESKWARTVLGSENTPSSSYFNGIIQAFVRLHQITGEAKYLTAAIEIADRVSDGPTNVESTTDLLTWHGILQLYEVTGEIRFLRKVEKVAAEVESMLAATGEVPYVWWCRRSTEACGTADYVRVNFDLFRATGKAHYLDIAERVIYNAYYYSQKPYGAGCGIHGPWFQPANTRQDEETLGVQDVFLATTAWPGENCCNWHVPASLYDIATHIYTRRVEGGFSVNLFQASQCSFDFPSPAGTTSVTFEQETSYPEVGSVLLKISATNQVRFPLQIRVPYWVREGTWSLNGEAAQPLKPGTFLVLERDWSDDTVHLSWPRQIRAENPDFPWGRIITIDNDTRTIERAVLFSGPMLLVLDEDRNPHLAPSWPDAYLLGIDPSLLVPHPGKRELFFRLPQDTAVQEANNPFVLPRAHFRGTWSDQLQPAEDTNWAHGRLAPVCEATGRHQGTFGRFVTPIAILDKTQQQSWESETREQSIFSPEFRKMLDTLEDEKVRTELLRQLILTAPNSWQAAIALARVGDSHDPQVLLLLKQAQQSTNAIIRKLAGERLKKRERMQPSTRSPAARESLPFLITGFHSQVDGNHGAQAYLFDPHARTFNWDSTGFNLPTHRDACVAMINGGHEDFVITDSVDGTIRWWQVRSGQAKGIALDAEGQIAKGYRIVEVANLDGDSQTDVVAAAGNTLAFFEFNPTTFNFDFVAQFDDTACQDLAAGWLQGAANHVVLTTGAVCKLYFWQDGWQLVSADLDLPDVQRLTLGNLDGDQYADLITLDSQGTVHWYEWHENQFMDSGKSFGTGYLEISLGDDVDQDQRGELLAVSGTTTTLHWLKYAPQDETFVLMQDAGGADYVQVGLQRDTALKPFFDMSQPETEDDF